MTAIIPQLPSFHDAILLKLAREIAMDIHPLDEILARHAVPQDKWDEIHANVTFQGYLRGAIEEWGSATNTAERVRLKSLAFVEEALPEFFARAHDAKENLQHKTDVLKTIAKLAGLEKNSTEASVGERLSVTINLGADHQLRVEKDITSQVTIEGHAE